MFKKEPSLRELKIRAFVVFSLVVIVLMVSVAMR